MSDISNKTLVALLVIAIVVSLAGTWISIGKLKAITGFQSSGTNPSGTVQLTQTAGLEITLWNIVIDFGSGRVNTTNNNDYCYINTNISATATGRGNNFLPVVAGYKNGSAQCWNDSFQIPQYGFEVENTGSIECNVSMNSSSGSTWIDGASLQGVYNYRLSAEDGNACSTGNVTSWTAMTTGMNAAVCGNLISGDAFQVGFQVGIPRDMTNGSKSDTVTFLGVASS